MAICRVDEILRSEDIILDCLARAVLHKRNMLVRSRVINDLRLYFRKDLFKAHSVAHRANQRLNIKLGMSRFELIQNIVCVVFVNIKNDQLFRIVLCKLTAKLASDRSATARYEYDLVLNIIHYAVKIDLDRIATEKVLYIDLSNRGELSLSLNYLVKRRNKLDLTARFGADLKDLCLFGGRARGNCENYAIYGIFFCVFNDRVAISDDLNTVDGSEAYRSQSRRQ